MAIKNFYFKKRCFFPLIFIMLYIWGVKCSISKNQKVQVKLKKAFLIKNKNHFLLFS